MQNPVVITLDNEKLAGWMAKGALPSVTVKTLIKQHKEASVETV
jgi:small subunit ribosomal protein S16